MREIIERERDARECGRRDAGNEMKERKKERRKEKRRKERRKEGKRGWSAILPTAAGGGRRRPESGSPSSSNLVGASLVEMVKMKF